MSNEARVNQFISTYQILNSSNLELLDSLYSENIVFIDPLHRVEGLSALKSYFAGLYQNIADIRFDIDDHRVSYDVAGIYWTMIFSHPRLKGGQEVRVEGHSRLEFKDNLICRHQDYFDVGAMLYRHIPLLGSVIRTLDKRLVSR